MMCTETRVEVVFEVQDTGFDPVAKVGYPFHDDVVVVLVLSFGSGPG